MNVKFYFRGILYTYNTQTKMVTSCQFPDGYYVSYADQAMKDYLQSNNYMAAEY